MNLIAVCCVQTLLIMNAIRDFSRNYLEICGFDVTIIRILEFTMKYFGSIFCHAAYAYFLTKNKQVISVLSFILLIFFHIFCLLSTFQVSQASRAESIECKNEMDPFPHLIFTEQMYLY